MTIFLRQDGPAIQISWRKTASATALVHRHPVSEEIPRISVEEANETLFEVPLWDTCGTLEVPSWYLLRTLVLRRYPWLAP